MSGRVTLIRDTPGPCHSSSSYQPSQVSTDHLEPAPPDFTPTISPLGEEEHPLHAPALAPRHPDAALAGPQPERETDDQGATAGTNTTLQYSQYMFPNFSKEMARRTTERMSSQGMRTDQMPRNGPSPQKPLHFKNKLSTPANEICGNSSDFRTRCLAKSLNTRWNKRSIRYLETGISRIQGNITCITQQLICIVLTS